jgi:hypothetical protein
MFQSKTQAQAAIILVIYFTISYQSARDFPLSEWHDCVERVAPGWTQGRKADELQLLMKQVIVFPQMFSGASPNQTGFCESDVYEDFFARSRGIDLRIREWCSVKDPFAEMDILVIFVGFFVFMDHATHSMLLLLLSCGLAAAKFLYTPYSVADQLFKIILSMCAAALIVWVYPLLEQNKAAAEAEEEDYHR